MRCAGTRANAGGQRNTHAHECLFSARAGSDEGGSTSKGFAFPRLASSATGCCTATLILVPLLCVSSRTASLQTAKSQDLARLATAHLAHLPSWRLLIHSASLARRPCILRRIASQNSIKAPAGPSQGCLDMQMDSAEPSTSSQPSSPEETPSVKLPAPVKQLHRYVSIIKSSS